MKIQEIIELINDSELAKKAETVTAKKLYNLLIERLAKRIFKEIKK